MAHATPFDLKGLEMGYYLVYGHILCGADELFSLTT